MIVELRLIQGDQLNPKHSWYKKIDDKILYVMMEIGSELKPIQQHAQKVIAFFGAMRFFAKISKRKDTKLSICGLEIERINTVFQEILRRL